MILVMIIMKMLKIIIIFIYPTKWISGYKSKNWYKPMCSQIK